MATLPLVLRSKPQQAAGKCPQEIIELGYKQVKTSPYYVKYDIGANFAFENIDLVYCTDESKGVTIELDEYTERLVRGLKRNKDSTRLFEVYIDYFPKLDAINICTTLIDKGGAFTDASKIRFYTYSSPSNMNGDAVYMEAVKPDNTCNVALFTRKADGTISYAFIFPLWNHMLRYACFQIEDKRKMYIAQYLYNEQAEMRFRPKQQYKWRYVYDVKTRHMYYIHGYASYWEWVVKSTFRRLRNTLWNTKLSKRSISSDLVEYRSLNVNDFDGSYKRWLSYLIRCKIRWWKWLLYSHLIYMPRVRVRCLMWRLFHKKEIQRQKQLELEADMRFYSVLGGSYKEPLA